MTNSTHKEESTCSFGKDHVEHRSRVVASATSRQGAWIHAHGRRRATRRLFAHGNVGAARSTANVRAAHAYVSPLGSRSYSQKQTAVPIHST